MRKLYMPLCNQPSKHALAQFSISPSLDFTLDTGMQQLEAISKPFGEAEKERASASGLFSTFTQKHQSHFIESSNERTELKHWKEFFVSTEEASSNQQPALGYEVSGIGAISHLYLILRLWQPG